MYISVFTDELQKEVTDILPTIASWGMEYVDFRSRINGKMIENQTPQELKTLRSQLKELGLQTGVIQSSLGKVHLPDADGLKREMEKLEGIIRAADALDCRYVRSFNFWQHDQNDPRCGELAMRPDALANVLEMYYPFAKRAQEAGLILGLKTAGRPLMRSLPFWKRLIFRNGAWLGMLPICLSCCRMHRGIVLITSPKH